MCIYPEGKVNKTGQNLLPFHNGSFKAAQKAEAPIVVAIITGPDRMRDAFLFSRKKVTLKILDMIPATEVKRNKTSQLAAWSKEIMENALIKERE